MVTYEVVYMTSRGRRTQRLPQDRAAGLVDYLAKQPWCEWAKTTPVDPPEIWGPDSEPHEIHTVPSKCC